MSTIKSQTEHLTLNADGSGKEIKFQCNGTEVAKIDSTGVDVSGSVTADGLTSEVSGGKFETDSNGFVISTQKLDVATAGGRFIGKSNRGELGHIGIEQTADSTDGGYIRFATASSGSTTPTDRVKIDSAGRVTMPYQPVATGTWGSMISSGFIPTPAAGINVNIGGCLAIDGKFTAPVTGTYWYAFTAMSNNSPAINVALWKNNAYTGASQSGYSHGVQYSRITLFGYLTLAANDYLQVKQSSSEIHSNYGTWNVALVT